jgi:hypothetical protein
MNRNNLNKQSTATQRFFWFCAGADIELLERCRSDWRKFTSIGVFVCVVALMATISGAFFLTESFQMPVYLAIWGGLFWGSVIFCVDRVMLAFYQKGSGEWKRILPRLILSLFISIVINEPMFVRVMRGEIEAKMFAEKQIVVNQTRANSHLQIRKTQIETEINELKTREKSLQEIKDNAEQEMEKERGGIKTDNTTGNLGEGSVYSVKKKIFENARKNYETEKAALDEQLNLKNQELQAVENDITKEVSDKDQAETLANGFWRRHEIMFSMMWQNPIMILVFLISSLVLLGVETLPLTQKFMARKSKYDFLQDKKDELAEEEANIWLEQEKEKLARQRLADQAVANRVSAAIVNGSMTTANTKEQKLLNLAHLEILRCQTSELVQSKTVSLGIPITIEVFDNPQISAQIAIPAEFENEATLNDLAKQIAELQTEVSKDEKRLMKLTKATNSDGEEVDRYFLSLIAQLNDDRRLLLRFEAENAPVN